MLYDQGINCHGDQIPPKSLRPVRVWQIKVMVRIGWMEPKTHVLPQFLINQMLMRPKTKYGKTTTWLSWINSDIIACLDYKILVLNCNSASSVPQCKINDCITSPWIVLETFTYLVICCCIVCLNPKPARTTEALKWEKTIRLNSQKNILKGTKILYCTWLVLCRLQFLPVCCISLIDEHSLNHHPWRYT